MAGYLLSPALSFMIGSKLYLAIFCNQRCPSYSGTKCHTQSDQLGEASHDDESRHLTLGSRVVNCPSGCSVQGQLCILVFFPYNIGTSARGKLVALQTTRQANPNLHFWISHAIILICGRECCDASDHSPSKPKLCIAWLCTDALLCHSH